jgi:hypothetical protein
MTDRRNLAAVAAGLGLTVTLLSGGIFAVFTDRATTGQNDATTRAEAQAADLKLATAAGLDCGAFVDDLATGVISVADLQPEDGVQVRVCLRNDGSAAVAVDVSVIDLLDLDVACTGDEAAAGDTTCGGDLLGEASAALYSSVSRRDCTTGDELSWANQTLASNAVTPIPLPGASPLAPGEIACILFTVGYYPYADQQLTQSDQATWRYAFDATAT